MYAIDEATRTPKNLVLKTGTDRLMVDISGATIDATGLTIDLTSTNAKLDTLIARSPDKSTDWQHAGAGIVNSTAAETVVAAVSDKRHYIEAVQLSSISGTGQHAVQVLSAATVIWTGAIDMAGNEPFVVVFQKPLKGGVNETISFKLVTVDPGTVFVSAQGYTL